MSSNDNYIKQSEAWQRGQISAIETVKNRIGYFERDIELTQKQLDADRELLTLLEENYQSQVAEYEKYKRELDDTDQ